MLFHLDMYTAQPTENVWGFPIEQHMSKFLVVASTKCAGTPIQCCEVVEAVDALEAVQLYSATAAQALEVAAAGTPIERRSTNVHAIAVPDNTPLGPVGDYLDAIETFTDADGALSRAIMKSKLSDTKAAS